MVDYNMPVRILRYADLEDQLGINRITIWRKTKTDPTFPKPIRLGGRTGRGAVGFLSDEVEAWLALQVSVRQSSES